MLMQLLSLPLCCLGPRPQNATSLTGEKLHFQVSVKTRFLVLLGAIQRRPKVIVG